MISSNGAVVKLHSQWWDSGSVLDICGVAWLPSRRGPLDNVRVSAYVVDLCCDR